MPEDHISYWAAVIWFPVSYTHLTVDLSEISEINDNPENIEKYLLAILPHIKKEADLELQDKKQAMKSIKEYRLLSVYDMLNSTGQMEAIKRVEELAEIKRYTEPEE